jgi:peptidylprolyl isomerase
VPISKGDYVLLNYSIYAISDNKEELVDTTDAELAKKAGIYNEKASYGPRLIIYGKSQLIEAVEEALKDMNEGEEREIEAPPEKAYGPRRDDLIVRIPIKQLRRYNIIPRVGREIEVGGRVGRIVRVTERFAYIDFNHPLAGRKLKIVLKVEKILKESTEKLRFLIKRWLGLEPVELKIENGVAKVILNEDVIKVPDLESRLQLLTRDIKDTFSDINYIEISTKIKVREKAKGTSEESGDVQKS